MSIRKWQLMELANKFGEITAWDVADELNVSPINARVMLLRAYKYRYLDRRKARVAGMLVYVYRLSKKALDFLEEYGSFTDHKWFH